MTGKWQHHASELPDGCADVVYTDPPYSEHVHSKSRAGARKVPLRNGNGRITKCCISREVDFGFEHITQDEREACADLIERVCKRWALVYSDVESAQDWAKSFCEFEYVRTCAMLVIGGTPQFSSDRPGHGFQALVCMHSKAVLKAWNAGGKLGVYKALTVIERGGQRHSNNDRVHTTQKDLMHTIEVVQDFTNPGEVVLDLYCGSATSGVACLRTGRRYIGFEMRHEMAQIARDRLTAEDNSSSIGAFRAGQLPLLGAIR